MSYYNDASLVLLAQDLGKKAGSVAAQKPMDANGQMTFTRTGDTATRVNASGLIEPVAANIARIDYPTLGQSGAGGGCGKLLLEPQRTNIATYSEQLNNAAWAQAFFIENVTANFATSPDGNQNADKVSDSIGTAEEYAVGQVFTSTTSTPHTVSVFLKASSSNFAMLRFYGNDAEKYFSVVVNLSNGTITKTQAGSATTSTASSITNYGNGWYRVTATATISTTTYYHVVQIVNSATPTIDIYGNFAYNGTGNNSVLVYGCQAELGAYATSYIPTLGAAVTRGADAASKTSISSLIGSTEGSAYFEANVSDSGVGSAVFFEIVNGTSITNTIVLYIDSANGRIALYLGPVALTPYLSATSKKGQNIKIAFRWKANDYAFYLDGLQVYTNTSAAAPSGLNNLRVGSNRDGTDIGKNLVHEVLLFNTALTNAQLAELTTI